MTTLLAPTDHTQCRPVRIVRDTEPHAVGRIGGHPPEGITPRDTSLRYFTTIQLSANPDLHASLFVGTLHTLLPIRSHVCTLPLPGVLELVVHPSRPRSVLAASFASPISPAGLVALEPRPDRAPDDDTGVSVPYSDHKLGGTPYIIRHKSWLQAELSLVASPPMSLVLQLDFPGSEDHLVSGSWPFADGIVAVFGRPPFDTSPWYCYWDA